MSVGWGVVGCGWVARDYVLPALRRTPGARLVGCCDRDPSALAHAAAPGELATTDLDELLAAPGVDAVYVATPNAAHPDVVAAAAAAGRAVLCEKPLAADAAGARRAVDACSAAGVLAGTAFDQRFHPAHQRIAEMVADGDLGTVTAVRITYGCWLPPAWAPPGSDPGDNWRVDPARAGGGAVIDLAPHGLDLVGALLDDDVAELRVLTQARVHDYPVDDAGALVGRTVGGVLYTAHVSFNTADALPRRTLEVVGTRAQLVARDTMGQTPGGSLTRIDAATGRSAPVGFDGAAGPFDRQVAAFTAAVAGRAPWPWPVQRDLRLHELLLGALGAADHEEVPSWR